MNKKAAIYARVSTVSQAEEGFSIDGQIALLKDICAKNKYDVYDIYVDRGISGKNMNRPALVQMNEDARNGMFDVIMVYKANRLARNTSDLLKMVEEYQKYNIEFISHTEKFDTTNAAGKLMLQIMASMAEYERNQIVENVILGQSKRARNGYYNGNNLLGYNKIPNDKKHLSVNESEAEIVRRIFNEYANGKGYRAIANGLNKDGLRTKKGNPFDIAGVKYILNNVFYIGQIKFQQYIGWNEKRRKGYNPNPIIAEGKHEPIIEKDLWNKVHRRMSEMSKKPQVHGKGTNVLTGLIRCPVCGHAHAAANTVNTIKGEKKKIRYYSCSQFKNKGASVCSANSVRADLIEPYVMNRIVEVINNDKILEKVVEKANERLREQPVQIDRNINIKKAELDELQTKLNNLTVALASSPDLAPVLKDSINEYQDNITKIENEILLLTEKLKSEHIPTISVDEVKAALKDIFKDVERLEKHQLKALYLSVIEEIHFRKHKEPGKKYEFFITLKITPEVLKEVFNDKQPEEAPLSASSLFLSNNILYLEI
ncbi:recombinase family protein [Macrococcoides bohemicum]|uniref:Recombinase family protein n=1 Tax=Macrococcoides bohemicum TaxID=1903056 RepID=A0AAE7U7J3_9STAP|nr:recombinase family protein [Macrococcus bohemicus]QRN48628.1 cassette chromosome recombinase Bm3 [Macrococcus bohemicus]QYA42425.1 recombinase family protein [Macrococcus bohemicus]